MNLDEKEDDKDKRYYKYGWYLSFQDGDWFLVSDTLSAWAIFHQHNDDHYINMRSDGLTKPNACNCTPVDSVLFLYELAI